MNDKVSLISEFGSKFFYSIAEVASIMSISESRLLQFAAIKKVKALAFINIPNVSCKVELPSKESVEIVHILNSEQQSDLVNSKQTVEHGQMEANYMAFLHLSPKTAENISKLGEAEQKNFLEAYKRTGESNEALKNNRRTLAICLYDAITHSSIDHLKRINLPIYGHFIFERRVIFEKPLIISRHQIYFNFIEVSALMLSIAHTLFNKDHITNIQFQFFEELKLQSPMSPYFELVNFQKKIYHSPQLVGLVETYHYFWDTIYFEVEHLPKASVIEAFLLDNYNFDAVSAKLTVKLFMPNYAGESPGLIQQLKQLGRFTPSLRAMVAASDHFYSKTSSNKNAQIISPLRLKQWLVKVHGFSPESASFAVQLILH
jgi:hypothetical protein